MSKSLSYDIVILTTAVTRPKLHSSVFKNIDTILKDYNCKWIISIDKILDASLEETKDNFYKILNYKNINLTIREDSNNASRMSWYESVKYCINKGIKYKPKFGYLWLEDDWIFESDKSLKHHMSSIENLSDKSFFISLVDRSHELNFNPSIWSNDLYQKYMFTKINSVTPDDTGGNAINRYGVSLFKDVGREWANKQISGNRTFN